MTASVDLFETHVLNRVVQDLRPRPMAILDAFFPEVQQEQAQFIRFDVENRPRRLAPFVSPLREGKIVQREGFETKQFAPAYVKPKQHWDPEQPLRRTAGESIGGSLTPEQRIQALIAQHLQEQLDMIRLRQEVMASECIRLATITVSGDDYPTQVVDLGRPLAHRKDISGTPWTGVEADLEDILAWALEVQQASGVRPTEMTFGTEAWKVGRKAMGSDLDTRRLISGELNTDRPLQEGRTFMGTWEGFAVYVYAGWYHDGTQEQPIFPAKEFHLGSRGLEGVRAFGAIRDEAAGYQALEVFSKSWVENDPPIRQIMSQSAPLPFTYRPSAGMSAIVLA